MAADLKLPTRALPPYSHQSLGKVARFHRNLFGQLRSTRLQWSRDLKVEHTLPTESLPYAPQHSTFILNNDLVHSSGKTSHLKNYRYNYRCNIVGSGECVLGEICNIPTQKLLLRNRLQSALGLSVRSRLTIQSSVGAPLLHF